PAPLKRSCSFGLSYVARPKPPCRPSCGHQSCSYQTQLLDPEVPACGADYLVVGRPIRDADDPRTAAEKIQQDILSALQEKVDNT
ncbi:MAG: orotidine 5'-phosphate decarboxylase, partial [Proteobacteria bacterium]|nr:orotidine 5'-phosphate decarboxylase [Pseudomonadota bacterium]